MTIILRTRTSQPQSPVGIDWGNPVTRGLASSIDWIGEKTLWDAARNMSIPMRMAYVGGAIPSIITPYGRAINEPINASDNSVSIGGIDTYQTIIRSTAIWVKDNSIATAGKIGLSEGSAGVLNSGTTGNTLYWSNVSGEKRLGLYLSWNNLDISVSNIPNGLHNISCIIANNRPALLFLNGQLVASSSNLSGYYYKSGLGIVSFQSATTSSLGIGYVVAKRLWVLPTDSYDTNTAREISSNPWQIFKPEARRVFTGYDSPSYIEDPVPLASAVASVTLSGVTSTTSVGNETPSQTIDISVSGVSGTTGIGSIDVSSVPVINISVSGVSATSSVGDDIPSQAVTLIVSGVSATGSIGNEGTGQLVNITLSGVPATGSVNSGTVSQLINRTLSGVSATGSIGNEGTGQLVNITLSGVPAISSVSTVSITISRTLAGATTTSTVGSVEVVFPYTPSLRNYVVPTKDNIFSSGTRTYSFVSQARNTMVISESRTTNVAANDRTYNLTSENRDTLGISQDRTTLCVSNSRTLLLVSSSRT